MGGVADGHNRTVYANHAPFRPPIEILLVEDNPADVRLMREVFQNGEVFHHLNVVADGEEAMSFLRREGPYREAIRPDLVLLDLNLPRKNGREVLQEIRDDPELTSLPVVVMSTSAADEDIRVAYQHHANCFLTKPVGFDEFIAMARSIEEFWLKYAQLLPLDRDQSHDAG